MHISFLIFIQLQKTDKTSVCTYVCVCLKKKILLLPLLYRG